MTKKILTGTPHWLMISLASILLSSAGIVTYNAFADGSNSNTGKDDGDSYNHNMTNGATQKQWYAYPHNYNMTNFGMEKDGNYQDDYNMTKSNTTSTSCGGGESLVNYVGNGATRSTLVEHNLGALPRIMYLLDLTNPPSSNVDGITTIISTTGIVYVESGNDAYAPIPISNTNIVNSTTIDVGQIFNQITQEVSNSKAVNSNGTSYELIAVDFASGNCSSSSHSSDDDDDDHR